MNKINVILLLLVLASAFAVVTVQDWSRQYFIALDKAQRDENLLDEDFSRLRLAQVRLSNRQIIQQASVTQHLQPPTLAATRMLPLSQQ
ncbi:cell division protein FtsL [Neisseriaceae bacterium ESL0693]|nr:cell division protein FtsL [Neisseriaceae bacterium ESL0693]